MKFLATLAAFAISAQAINLEAAVDADVEAGWNGPIVPESYEQAVHEYDLHSPITDQDCYQKQVDIYSDQIIAIEALRLEVLQLTQRVTQAEHDYQENAAAIDANLEKIHQNAEGTLRNKAKIDVLFKDVHDVADCLHRQWDEQQTLRHVLELYCHQFTYVSHLPAQCEAILGSGTHLNSSYAWPSNTGVAPEYW